MKKIIVSCMLLLSTAAVFSQTTARTNDWRFRWNIGQFANVGRYALQFGVERDIADNKTLSGELGFSFFRGDNNLIYQRYNYAGVQGMLEYRNYFKGFHEVNIKPFMAVGLFARSLNFDADVTLGYDISSTRDWNSASSYENATTRYSTTTGRVHLAFGLRAPISPMMYFEATCGPAFGYYNIKNDLKRDYPFVVDNFNNPFFMSSQPGGYFSPALYGSVSFGFVIAKGK